MNFIMQIPCILVICFLAQCQAKVIYPEILYVDENGNYYLESAAYGSTNEIKSDGSGDYESGFNTIWDDEGDDDFHGPGSGHLGIISNYGSGFISIWDDEGGDDEFEGSGSGDEGIISDYGSGFISIWDDEGGEEDDFEGSGSGHGGISTISPKVFEDDLHENHKDSNMNRSIIFPDEDVYVENQNNSKVNQRELDHISESSEKEVVDEDKNSLTDIIIDINLETENEFYFNKEVTSNLETVEYFADPEAVHFIYENEEHYDSSLGTMKIIMLTSAGILIVLVLLLIIILIVYLTSRNKKEMYTASGDVKRIRLLSTSSTMKI